ncbi:hypothetical protein [Blastococcus colisei]|nr:hypothetical protein [Blastococcus colisei]
MTMLGVVLAGVLAPLRLAPTFYYWDDTAAASVGAWRAMGAAALEGRLLPLDLEMWRGGNLAAEAAFGLYNPLLTALSAATMPIDDLALVALVIKGFFFLVMALGVYLLCREYGARPWPAALAGSMLPLSGFTLWMDGAAWVTGLTVTALTPWVWYTAKRAAEARGSLLWVVLAGYLCGSAGNPYGLIATAIVIGAVIVEAFLCRRPKRTTGLVVVGIAVALLCVATYLPFVLSSSVSYRTGSQTLNDEYLSPGLTELLGLSSPSLTPYMPAFSYNYFTFPAAFLAWFVLPLAPWLRWPLLRSQARRLAGPFVFGAVYLLLLLGPSQVWFFRWPFRLIPYLWLGVVVLFAVLLSAGLDRSHARVRWLLSALAVFAGLWLAWSDMPGLTRRHVFYAGLITALLWLVLRMARRSERNLVLVALGGTLLVLVLQLRWMPVNANMSNYNFPRSESAMQETFADYGPGVTVQLAYTVGKLPTRNAEGIYQDILFGSMHSVAGVESLTAYSGVGFNALDRALCMNFQGATCREAAWEPLWEEPEGSDVVLADLLKADTVVVQRDLIDTSAEPSPEGWELTESTEFADIWRRTGTLPWPDGRLSAVSGPVEVTADQRTSEVGETVTFEREGPGRVELTFARLAWPGYTATVDGETVPVGENSVGLLTVALPAGADAGTLTLSWTPPGAQLSLAAVGLGGLAVVALAAVELRHRRSRGTDSTARRRAEPAEAPH